MINPDYSDSVRKPSFYERQPYYFAITILAIGVIALAITAVGAHYGVWSAGALDYLTRAHTFILLSASGGALLLLFTAAIAGSLKWQINSRNDEYTLAQQDYEAQLRQRAHEVEQLTVERNALQHRITEAQEQAARAQADHEQQVGELTEQARQKAQLRQEAFERELAEARRAERELLDKLLTAEATLRELRERNAEALLSASYIANRPGSPSAAAPQWTQRAWRVFTYDQVAEQKYHAVLDQYVWHLQRQDFDLESLFAHPPLRPIVRHLLRLEKEGDARLCYQHAIRELRALIVSSLYQELPADDPIKHFVHAFCLIRWKGTHLYSYLEETVQLTVDSEAIAPSNLRAFPHAVMDVNTRVKHSPHKKPVVDLQAQKLAGAVGVEDFCGNKNTPNVRHIQTFTNASGETREISYVRHGSPTALGHDYSNGGIGIRKFIGTFLRAWSNNLPDFAVEIDTGEVVTVDYHEYLLALAARGESELFCIHQRRTPDIFEDERTRVMRIEALQQTHDNIFVLTQPVEGDLFEHRGEYSKMTSFDQLFRALETEFFDRDPDHIRTRASLPYCLRGDAQYRAEFRRLLRVIKEVCFQGDTLVTQDLSSELDEQYLAQTEQIKGMLRNLNLRKLNPIEEPVFPREILERILADEALKEHLVQMVSQESDLAQWLPSGTEPDLDNIHVRGAALHAIVGTVIHNILQENRALRDLEERQAELIANWQSFISLFYAFQRMDLKVRLHGVNNYRLTAYKNPCKDHLDRGGNQAFVEDRLLHYMLGQQDNPQRMEEALYNLLGPPILVKKKEAIPRRILPGMKVEQLLRAMPSYERLRNYQFGGEWKIADIKIPRVPGQSGVPHIRRIVKEEVRLHPDQVGSILQRFSGLKLKQWEPRPNSGGDPNEESTIRQQFERDFGGSAGTGYLLTTASSTSPITGYKGTKEALLAHPLINQNEQKALQILASFHQGLGGIVSVAILETLSGHARLKNKEPQGNETIRTFHLDLKDPTKITMRYADALYVCPNEEDRQLAELNVYTKVEYEAGDSQLTSQIYTCWNVV